MPRFIITIVTSSISVLLLQSIRRRLKIPFPSEVQEKTAVMGARCQREGPGPAQLVRQV